MADDVLRSAAEEIRVPVSLQLCYRTRDGRTREIKVSSECIARPAEAASTLGLTITRGAGTYRVCAEPLEPVTITTCVAYLDLDLDGADALYLNGYNSWTDSWERPVDARMRGLARVPRRIVDRWGLDGSGDYRFTPEDERPGYQHGFGYGYLRHGEDVLLVGSLDETNGFTTLYEELPCGRMRLDKEVPAREVAAGERYELMSFVTCRGGLDEAVSRWLELSGIEPRQAPPLVGFSSWYRYYQDIDQKRLEADLAAVRDLLSSRDLGPCTPVFQIDDGYARIGDWLEPYEDRFPDGMAHFPMLCEEAGLLPGLWMAPLVCETDSRLFEEHQDWLLHDESGELVMLGSNWSGYYALDTRNEDAREYIRASLWTATHEWGYRLLKLDFLFAACMLPHDGLNRGELMADALDLLRASVEEGVAFDLCGVPIAAALGKTEYCRIGCDVGLDWDDVPYMRLLHRERVSTKRSLADTRGRAHLDRRAFRNDPDVFYLRRDVKLKSKQRHDLLSADAALGGMLLTSDDVSEWDEGQRLAFDLALAVFVGKES